MSDLLFSPKGEELWLNDPEKTPGPPCQLSRRLPSPVVLQAIIEADAFSTIIKEQEVSHATQMVLAVDRSVDRLVLLTCIAFGGGLGDAHPILTLASSLKV